MQSAILVGAGALPTKVCLFTLLLEHLPHLHPHVATPHDALAASRPCLLDLGGGLVVTARGAKNVNDSSLRFTRSMLSIPVSDAMFAMPGGAW